MDYKDRLVVNLIIKFITSFVSNDCLYLYGQYNDQVDNKNVTVGDKNIKCT